MSPSFNLSDATMLKDVEFQLHEPNVKWITATLQTAGFKNLQQITIRLDFAAFLDGIPETTRLEWQELDDLLVQLWTTRSIVPAFTYVKNGGRSGLGVPKTKLMPKLASRGFNVI